MLDFWYSSRCTREIKILICILTCVIIFLCSKIAALSPVFVGISLAIGILIHFFKMLSLKIQSDNQYQAGFQIIFFVIPLTITICLLTSLPKQHLIALVIQSIGFIGLGLFIVSIYSNRAKRFE